MIWSILSGIWAKSYSWVVGLWIGGQPAGLSISPQPLSFFLFIFSFLFLEATFGSLARCSVMASELISFLLLIQSFRILNEITSDQPERGISGRKDPDHSGSATNFFMNPLEWVGWRGLSLVKMGKSQELERVFPSFLSKSNGLGEAISVFLDDSMGILLEHTLSSVDSRFVLSWGRWILFLYGEYEPIYFAYRVLWKRCQLAPQKHC